MRTFMRRFLLLLMIVSSFLVSESIAARTGLGCPGLGCLLEIKVVATVKITKLSLADTYSTDRTDFDDSCEDFFVENPTDCPMTHKTQSKIADQQNTSSS